MQENSKRGSGECLNLQYDMQCHQNIVLNAVHALSSLIYDITVLEVLYITWDSNTKS